MGVSKGNFSSFQGWFYTIIFFSHRSITRRLNIFNLSLYKFIRKMFFQVVWRTYLRRTYDVPTTYLWRTYDVPTTYLRRTYNVPTTYLRHTALDKSLLTSALNSTKRPLTVSLSAVSWSFSQLQILAASQLGPLLQLLFSWVTEISVVLKQESKNQNGNFSY